MEELPSNTIFDIFSRFCVKSLARNRCVSKLWCEYIDDPHLRIIHAQRNEQTLTLIMFHNNPPHNGKPHNLCFDIIKSSKHESTSHVLETQEKLDLEFVCKTPLSTDLGMRVRIRGSCHGLLLITQHENIHKPHTHLTAIHLLRKECYDLPTSWFRLPCNWIRESCGLGFDDSTNNYKMVCILLKKNVSPKNLDLVRKNLCTMVHVFGTNSWQEIPQVPSYPVDGEAIFVHGCLYWLVSYLDRRTHEIIWFDVAKEIFGLINPPLGTGVRNINDHLVDLNGEVGLVCDDKVVTTEVWVFKHKQWVFHCKFNKDRLLPKCCRQVKSFPIFPNHCVKVLGYWNKDGDILITASYNMRNQFFVYNLKTGVCHGFVCEENQQLEQYKSSEYGRGIIMYPNNLFSIHGINTNSCALRSKHQTF